VGPGTAWFTVVGVAGTVRQEGLREDPQPLVYYGLNETAPNGTPRLLTFALRGPNLASRADAIRQAVWSLDGDMPIAAMQTMDEVVEGSIVQFTFTMMTLGIAAAIALMLGAVGLFGVLSYAVSLRTREIGLRLALGAAPARVMRSVVATGAAIAGIGLVIGVAGAVGLTRLLDGILVEVEALDPATFAGMAVAHVTVRAGGALG